MKYKPIVPQDIPMVIKYVYSLYFESFLKYYSEATSCSKGLKHEVSSRNFLYDKKKRFFNKNQTCLFSSYYLPNRVCAEIHETKYLK